MKSGTGDDPFADDPESDDELTQQRDTEITMDTTPDTTTEAASTDTKLPYIFARSTVKEDRNAVRQFFLREHVAEGEEDLVDYVKDELGTKDVAKLDVREAAYLIAQRHPEEVANLLREWGYEYR